MTSISNLWTTIPDKSAANHSADCVHHHTSSIFGIVLTYNINLSTMLEFCNYSTMRIPDKSETMLHRLKLSVIISNDNHFWATCYLL